MRSIRLVVVATSVGLAAPVCLARQQFVILTPTTPTYDSMQLNGVSGDGHFVIGQMGSASLLRATRWTADNLTRVELGLLAGRPYSQGTYLSQNGSKAAADALDGSFNPQIYQWTSPSTRVTVPFMTGGTYTYSAGMSSDGLVIAGWGTITGAVQRPCRWTSAGTAIVPLPSGVPANVSSPPNLQYSRLLSGNGNFIIGNTINFSTGNIGYLYNATTNVSTDIGQMQAGKTPYLTSISNDGSIVIGHSDYLYPDQVIAQVGFMWTAAGGFVNLGSLTFEGGCNPPFLSGNGQVVLGDAGGVSFVWTAATGMQPFSTFLTAHGVDTQGMTDLTFSGISDDGLTIVGMGNTAASLYRGWILTLPACYPNCDGSSSSPRLTANDFQCFLNAFAAGQGYANCDGSTSVPILTANDFQCFLNAYAAGCS